MPEPDENQSTSTALQRALTEFLQRSRTIMHSRQPSGSIDLSEQSGSTDVSNEPEPFQAADEIDFNGYKTALAMKLTNQWDPHLQNGTRGMSARVEAGDQQKKTAEKDSNKVSISKPQLAAGLILALAAIIVAIIVTYAVTKESVSKSAAQGSYVTSTVPSNYKDEFDKEPPLTTESSTNNKTETSPAETGPGPTPEELRLATNLVPIWYNLTLKIFIPGFVPIVPEKNLTFEGALITKFKVVEATNKIELSANGLNLNNNTELYQIQIDQTRVRRSPSNSTGSALLVSTNGTKQLLSDETSAEVSAESVTQPLEVRVDAGIKVVAVKYNETLQKVVFELDQQLAKDKIYYFLIPYSGPINNNLNGMYVTKYDDANGKEHLAAVTQMEPTDARRVAPCFDEPAFKAVWRLRVIHPTGSSAVSNAKEIKENEPTTDSDWVMTNFEETLPMSSYLLAVVVSDFEYVEGHTKNNVRFRIWARKEALNYTQFALEAGIKCLEYYEEFYGIPFPLSKQDMMAFPDFAAGAMENWGLVTYREKFLLYTPKLYSPLQKLSVAAVVAHELAHQWFGNLVTMKWWSDLWLNEGFATLVEHFGMAHISGEKLDIFEYFITDTLANALEKDSRASSHPLSFDISKAEDVGEAFDIISYDKGASILQMIRNIMGEKAFQKGCQIYLNRFKYSNAEHKDLWAALSEAVPANLTDASGDRFDVDDFAKPWTKQMGYPVIEVKRTSENKVELSQKRFKMDETALEKPKFRNAKYWYKWDVPLWYSVNGTEQQMSWLHDKTELDVDESTVFVANVDSKGFYRVQYSKNTLDMIRKQLLEDHTKITTKSRARIVDDTFVLAQAGRLPYQAALNLTVYLDKETEYIPWFMAFAGLDAIEVYFGDEPELDYIHDYIVQLVQEQFNKINFEKLNQTDNGEKFMDHMLQTQIINQMIKSRNQECLSKILNIYFNDFVYPCQNSNTPSSECSVVPTPIRQITYCEGIRSGTEKDWDNMFKLYVKEPMQVEKNILMSALACTRDTHVLKKILRMTTDTDNDLIRLQDKSRVFDAVAQTAPLGQQITMDYFMEHWNEIYENFKTLPHLLKVMIHAAIGGSQQRAIEQVTKFLAENENTRNIDAFKERLEIMQTNHKWMNKNFQPLAKWFRQQTRTPKQS